MNDIDTAAAPAATAPAAPKKARQTPPARKTAIAQAAAWPEAKLPKRARASGKKAAEPAGPAAAKRSGKKPPADGVAPPVKPGKAAPVEAAKPEKMKLVRDSFTIPADEYELLAALKQRALQRAHPAKKSEVLRAGLKVLAALDDDALLAALQAVPSIKTGRPKAKKGE